VELQLHQCGHGVQAFRRGDGACGDLDNDRDFDLVVATKTGPAHLLRNDLFSRFSESPTPIANCSGARGALLQDFNGDSLLDLLSLDGSGKKLSFQAGAGQGTFRPVQAFDAVASAAVSRGTFLGFRAADLDLDGDLDLACYSDSAVHALLNDGRGNFVVQDGIYRSPDAAQISAVDSVDLSGDLVPDLLVFEGGATNQLLFVEGRLSPPSTAVALQPLGIRNRDGRTRSPALAYGTRLLTRVGLREHHRVYSGQAGGFNQSGAPELVGLAGAARVDYVSLAWPDGVVQTEIGLTPGQVHKISELQRKLSSCPVLFTWSGSRFDFVTDFAGVGGLGYMAAPGIYAPPQVLEHVKIEGDKLRARDGFYELRVTEPMEEAAYIDRLELLAIDHTAETAVFPDERLAVSGPLPTHELLVVGQQLFPASARDPWGRECRTNIMAVDRMYAYEPPLDRRYFGFCRPHSLELDFADQLAAFAEAERVFLFINGYIEFPYSQTVFAASQSRIGWEPIRVERQDGRGEWVTSLPDAGVPGGMGRTMTVELTGKLAAGTRKLRLTTNLEISYDQVFIARDMGTNTVSVRSLALAQARLQQVGFAREYSPDGRKPLYLQLPPQRCHRAIPRPQRCVHPVWPRRGAIGFL
jgi:hypothetical protein